MGNEKINVEELRQKREQLRAQKKKKQMLAVAAVIILVVILILFCFLKLFNKGTVNLEKIKAGTTEVINKDAERQSILNIYADNVIGSFNPAYAASYGDQMISQIVFEPLMKRDEAGELENHLIKSLQIAEDGKSYSIKIDTDICFSDGSNLTVHDVAASIAAMALTGNGGSASEAYSRIEGMDEFVENPTALPAGLEEVDDMTLKIHFTEPSPDNLLVMETQIQKAEFAEELESGLMLFELQEGSGGGIGTGAYQFADTSSGSYATLVVNESFHEQIYDIKKIEFRAIDYYDSATAVENGELDAAIYSGTSPLFDTLYSWDGFDVYAKPDEVVYSLFYNKRSYELENAKVRQAIAYGFNREEALEGELGRYLVYQDNLELDVSKVKTNDSFAYNQKQAKKLLEEARAEVPALPEDITLTLPILQDNELHNLLAEALKEDMSEIGITIDVEALSEQDYMMEIYLQMDFDLYLTGVTLSKDIASYKNFYQDQGGLPTGVSDHLLNEAYEALAKSIEPKDILKAKGDLNDAIGQLQTVLPVGRSRNYVSLSADLNGFEATPYVDFVDRIHTIRVEK